MQKVLVIFIVVLASYLVFEQFNNEDDSVEPVKASAIKMSNKSVKERVSPEPLYEVEATDIPEVDSFNNDYIEATYAATLDEDHIKASLRFSFSKDGTFRDYRDMSFPTSKAGEATGTYTVDGALLNLTYNEDRDQQVFKFSQAQMSLHKDGTLRTGTVVLNKQ
jgi:hypothetical protein